MRVLSNEQELLKIKPAGFVPGLISFHDCQCEPSELVNDAIHIAVACTQSGPMTSWGLSGFSFLFIAFCRPSRQWIRLACCTTESHSKMVDGRMSGWIVNEAQLASCIMPANDPCLFCWWNRWFDATSIANSVYTDLRRADLDCSLIPRSRHSRVQRSQGSSISCRLHRMTSRADPL